MDADDDAAVNVLLGQAAMNLAQAGRDITSDTLFRELESLQRSGPGEAHPELFFNARMLLKWGSGEGVLTVN